MKNNFFYKKLCYISKFHENNCIDKDKTKKIINQLSHFIILLNLCKFFLFKLINIIIIDLIIISLLFTRVIYKF